jgi:hypothetical protein
VGILGREGIRLERHRYGATELWSVADDVAGSAARRLGDRVDLFFRDGDGGLLLDLRGARRVDSAGARAIARCRRDHPGFRTVGRPASWADLPLGVRVRLQELDPAQDLEGVLGPAAARTGLGEHRRHARIPLQLPVEIALAGATTLVALRDVSRGGVRLGLVPADWVEEIRRAGPAFSLGILGLDADPLARELAGAHAPGPVPAVPVHLRADGAVGARFPEAGPPV